MTEYIGHFHPLLVHLPIGIFIFLFIASCLPASQWELMKGAITLALLIAATGAIFACIAGYILSLSGEYDETLTQRHQWLGIATAALSLLSWKFVKYRRMLIWTSTLVMTVASHYGGSLTHGEGYLFGTSTAQNLPADSSAATEKTTTAFTADTSGHIRNVPVMSFPYRDEVKPILQQKCYNCHSSIKKKGGLRLDSEAFILKGGKNGAVLTANNPASSTLYTHLVLPVDDELHMPPQGRKQLTSAEINVIHRWIAGGAAFIGIPSSSAPSLDAHLTVPAAAPSSDLSSADTPHEEVAPENPTVESSPAVEGLIREGLVVQTEGQNISVNFVNVRSITPSMISELENAGTSIVELKFGGLSLSNADLEALPTLKNLRNLNLAQSAITDEGILQLKKFPSLENLRLYETVISDKSAETLSSLSKLKRLFIWKTNITSKGLQSIRAKNPRIQIESGLFTLTTDSLKKN